ncbi:MAG TPA: energy transducer TonB [Steroidobacteraceae bacterium]|nr:energy transducer TonB [Steroidobacteraceae bacterium]
MLASDQDGGLDALKFNLASDIVELVVLSADPVFLHTLRDAVGGARRLWNVASADKVSDLLVAGEVGIVVLDLQALNETASVFIGQIKRQFPDLVVIVAGNRDDESSLASLISAGTVYRFIHKPMSPARAKLFAEAAIKKHDELRLRAAEFPLRDRAQGSMSAWLIGGTIGLLALIVVVAWLVHNSSARNELVQPPAAEADNTALQSPLLARAAAALAANKLTEPDGDNALELYQQALANNSADPTARGGLVEVHERLLALAENALLEDRLDEAGAAIETARKAGVEGSRMAFLTAQLAKSREQLKAAQARPQAVPRVRNSPPADVDRVAPLLDLAAQSMRDGRLLAPDRASARFYVQEALRLDPNNSAAQEARRSLASRLLTEVRSAIDRRDFSLAASLIEGAAGLAAAADLESAQGLLAAARKQADVDARVQLLKNANDRMLEDRLIEPDNDNAKYFLLNLRRLDPGNAGLTAAMQDLGSRLVAKARRALALEQYDAARSWLDEAAQIGFASTDANSAQRDLDAAVAKRASLATMVPASQLTLLKSVQPTYPNRAAVSRTEGWVELGFTVSETGQVKDVVVHATSVPGVFEDAAVRAVSQWRYQPVLRDAKPVPVRTELRIRFALS